MQSEEMKVGYKCKCSEWLEVQMHSNREELGAMHSKGKKKLRCRFNQKIIKVRTIAL
jgi:hypothetical protein